MKASLFIKYGDYKTGTRFRVYDDGCFEIEHNAKRDPEDELYPRGFASIEGFRDRLEALFGHVEGERWFIYFVQDLLHALERMYVKNPRRRRAIAKKKAATLPKVH